MKILVFLLLVLLAAHGFKMAQKRMQVNKEIQLHPMCEPLGCLDKWLFDSRCYTLCMINW